MVAAVLESGVAFPPWFQLISVPLLGARFALTAAFQHKCKVQMALASPVGGIWSDLRVKGVSYLVFIWMMCDGALPCLHTWSTAVPLHQP